MDGGGVRSDKHAPRASPGSSKQREARIGQHRAVGRQSLAQPQGKSRQDGTASGCRTSSEIHTEVIRARNYVLMGQPRNNVERGSANIGLWGGKP